MTISAYPAQTVRSAARSASRFILSAVSAAGLVGPAAHAASVDTSSRAFTTLVNAICGDGWADLNRLKELGMVDDGYLKKAVPEAERACNSVYGTNFNGIGALLILKYNAFAKEDISWVTQSNITNGSYYEAARLVAKVPRAFALAEYYSTGKAHDNWEPASLLEVTKKWVASGADVNLRTCQGFRLADRLILSASNTTTEFLKKSGADFNYRTPFVLKDGFLAYYNRDHSSGNQYSVNFTKYGVYYYGKEDPSFETTYMNKCVTDSAVNEVGMTYVEMLVYFLVEGDFWTKRRMDILKAVIKDIDLPKDIVHALIPFNRFPRNGLEVLDVLLANGADINARNRDGQTLVERVYNTPGNSTATIKELVARGAQL